MAGGNDDDDEDIAEEMALGAAGANPDVASQFLKAKTEILREQLHQLRLSHFREWLYASAEMALGLIVLLIFVGIASAVWSAAHDNGLVIESFSVPPDFQARGLNGQVVASQLLDRLAAMQAQTNSSRAASSYSNDWGNDIKVQIPDTGVSIGELNSYLRDWLGSATHITGDVYRDGGNVTVATRVAGTTISASGPQSDFAKLLQKVAEGVYQQTQPYRYAVYLENANKTKRAEAAYLNLIATGSQQDKAWAYIGLSTIYSGRSQYLSAFSALHSALAIYPDFPIAYLDIAGLDSNLKHDEASLQTFRKLASLAQRGGSTGMTENVLAITAAQARSSVAGSLGDFQQEIAVDRQAEALPGVGSQAENFRDDEIGVYGFLHDGKSARKLLAAMPPATDPNTLLNREGNMFTVNVMLEQWNAALAAAKGLNAALDKFGAGGMAAETRIIAPQLAYTQAGLGDFKAAGATIAKTPLDCDLCVRLRGRIAASERRWNDAAHWYGMLSARTPSIPFADSDWGFMLLAKGDLDGAIAKYQSALRKGPHFADPLEGWGEVLMMKNRSDLALIKFEEANKYAPNWGRLHLKWGEALFWSGDKERARKQFAIAAHLDLTPSEKSELERLKARRG